MDTFFSHLGQEKDGAVLATAPSYTKKTKEEPTLT